MQLVKVGRKGRVSIPTAMLRKLGIRDGATMVVEFTAEGGILLRQAGVYPIEIYSEERIREFDPADRMRPTERKKVTRAARRSG